jgi:hypothetical protein
MEKGKKGKEVVYEKKFEKFKVSYENANLSMPNI